MLDRLLYWVAERDWAVTLAAVVGVLAGVVFMLLVLDVISPYRR